MTTSVLTRLTLGEYLALPETNLPTELVDGVLIVSAMANARHQRAARRLLIALDAACPPGFEALGPLEWLLRTEPPLVRQPDLAVVPSTVVDDAVPRLVNPPLLAVEILSADSVERDVVTKRREYFEAGLAHYWIVDPDEPAIVALDTSGQYAHAQADEPFVVNAPFSIRIIPQELVTS